MKILQEPGHQPYAMKYKETIVNANNGKLYIYDCNGTYVTVQSGEDTETAVEPDNGSTV